MRPGNAPRSVPSAHRSRSVIQFNPATPFPGDQSVSSSRNYVLVGDSQIGLQNSPTDLGQSIDLSGESSRPSLPSGSDLPWNHLSLGAAETPTRTASNRIKSTDSAGPFRTPNRNIDAFPEFSVPGSFRDSALGTFTASSHHETQSLLSSSQTDVDHNLDFRMALPSQPQEVYTADDEDDMESQGEPDDDEPRSNRKNPRQPRSKQGLTCPNCGVISKTPSDFKYDLTALAPLND
jgi:hypothetical protein